MAEHKPGFVERPVFVLLVAALGFFLLSFIGMGLAPWTSLRKLVNPEVGFQNPYIGEDGQPNGAARGRGIYIKEGCWHCHSQFVRPIAGEPFRYGPPSTGWESMFDVPQTFGTRRIGPDLSREAGKRTSDWHLAHLYNPRLVVPLSVMPSYPWYFETVDGGIKPTTAALDLIEYLETLGRPFAAQIEKITYPPAIKIVGAPDADDIVGAARGEELFADHCAGCHGAKGDGDSAANAFLAPAAVDLTSRYISINDAFSVLYGGIKGSAMPSFREMPDKDLWALSKFVTTLGEAVRAQTTAAAPATIAQGRRSYETLCVSCHGATGVPDPVMAASLQPAPRAFRYRIFKPEFVVEVLNTGRAGTSMPAFRDLPDEEKAALAAFLTTLFSEGAL